MFLADRLEKPVLVEGPAGVGKTELAKAVAAITGARLIRLQCYEGLDESKAIYEWNYKKQLLRIQADREHERDWETVEADIFSEAFLLTRPLLEAIRADEPVVLLIDEVDRVEIETEALLLEVLSDFQVSIPELGTIEGKQRPIVFLTSNNTRELSEALKRRCLFLHIDYPELEREKEIVRVRVPEIDDALAEQIAKVVGSIRNLDLKKAPSISETIDWARTLLYLGRNEITPEVLGETLHVLLKYQTDIAKARKELGVDAPATPQRAARDESVQWSKLDYAMRAAQRGSDAVTSVPAEPTMLDVLQGFVHELRLAGLPGVDDREPRRDARGRARAARRPRRVQGRARRDAGEAPRPPQGVRHRVRGLLLDVQPGRRRGRRRPAGDADAQADFEQLRAAMDGGGAMGQLSNEELAQMLLDALMHMDREQLRQLAAAAVRAVRGHGAGPAGRRRVLPLPHAAAARRRGPRRAR